MAAGHNMFNNKDSMDISELASLNEDISDDLIDQLQKQITENAGDIIKPAVNPNDDSTLFEEPVENAGEQTSEDVKPKEPVSVKADFDDNFIKKYKAKLNKKAQQAAAEQQAAAAETADTNSEAKADETQKSSDKKEEQIEKLSKGKISEKPITKEQKQYNDSLDYLDGNVKYSKYVIYIDPQNVNFIEGLTVKERKNLINNILKQQNDISLTKQRFKVIQTTINHIIIAILTVAISIPVIYYTINSSLEASINNYRRSQTNFQTLYKEKGKITNTKN